MVRHSEMSCHQHDAMPVEQGVNVCISTWMVISSLLCILVIIH